MAVNTPITGGSSWKLTFDEEFNGNAIDKQKWQVPGDGTADHTYPTYGNAQFWDSTNLTVANGIANFAVTQTGGGYHTAAITSNYLQTYGYWEARIKLPSNAPGIGADFWTDAQGWTFPENDISEWLGSTPTSDYTTWHYANPVDGNNAVGVSNTVTGLDPSAWHVVGALWTPTAISWYYDGVQVFQTSTNVNAANAIPQWVILDATVGGFNGNTINGSTVFPANFQVDYVHVYSNDPNAVAVTPQANYGGPGDTGGGIATAPATAPAAPDLVVNNVGWSPASAQTGDALTFSATVTNQGTAPTPAGTVLAAAFFVDGAKVSWSDNDFSSLAPGASVTLTANDGPVANVGTWTATAGTHTIEAYVDDVNRIPESNDTNNTLSNSFTVNGTTASNGGDPTSSGPPAPSNLDLAAGLDSGVSGHHLTNAANPVIVGVGQPGDTLTLFDGTAPVGSGTVAGDGSWAVPTTALADGVHTLAATETDAAGNVSTPSQPLTLTVDGGSNILNGGSGNNVLYGSSGSDAFVFDQPLDPSANVDQIFDFNSVEDRIALNYDIFPGLGGAGPLPATEFSIGPAAAAGSAHINYDTGSGALSYVAHGLGDATRIATLPADLPITAANFQLF